MSPQVVPTIPASSDNSTRPAAMAWPRLRLRTFETCIASWVIAPPRFRSTGNAGCRWPSRWRWSNAAIDLFRELCVVPNRVLLETESPVFSVRSCDWLLRWQRIDGTKFGAQQWSIHIADDAQDFQDGGFFHTLAIDRSMTTQQLVQQNA